MANDVLGHCPDCGAPILVTIRPGLPVDIPDHGCPSRACEYTGCRMRRPADEMVQFATGGWFCPGHGVFLAASDLLSLHRADGSPDWKGIGEVLAEALPDIVQKFERSDRSQPA